MTAICGVIAPSDRISFESCRRSLFAQRTFGANPQVHSRGWVALGYVNDGSEGCFASSGPLAIVADARIDNRDELRDSLGLSPSLSVAELLLAAWMREGQDALRKLSGSFAFAVADDRIRRISLVRDQAGSRPLVKSNDSERWAFASMPSGVLEFAGREPDIELLALRLTGSPRAPTRVPWRGMALIEKAAVTHVSNGDSVVHRYFDPFDTPEGRGGDSVDEFRDCWERAVRLSLADSGDPVAVHLSSGFDSSAVAGTASQLAGADRELILYTSVPAFPEAGLAGAGRIADESETARLTSARLGAKHVIIRDESRIADQIRGKSAYFEDVVPNPLNLGWWSAINRDARDRGASVLLSALGGNATISYGGLATLAEYLAGRKFVEFIREAVASHRENNVTWKGVALSSIAPFLSTSLYRTIVSRLSADPADGRSPFLSAHARELVSRAEGGDPVGTKAARLAVLQRSDDPLRNKGMQALTGIEERDPCVEPGLVRFCFGLPPETRLRNGRFKPLLREALKDVLIDDVRSQQVRGEQGSDWYGRINREDCLHLIEECRTSVSAQELLDFRRLGEAVDQWPAFDPGRRGQLFSFAMQITDALAAGIFLSEAERYPPASGNLRQKSSIESA